ncbi:MAG: hypothetical protein OEY67_10210 [Gammaproteobacteria bacterium]|nr:hypothetical protein [Gammaproteobacteria bacterium]
MATRKKILKKNKVATRPHKKKVSPSYAKKKAGKKKAAKKKVKKGGVRKTSAGSKKIAKKASKKAGLVRSNALINDPVADEQFPNASKPVFIVLPLPDHSESKRVPASTVSHDSAKDESFTMRRESIFPKTLKWLALIAIISIIVYFGAKFMFDESSSKLKPRILKIKGRNPVLR